MGDKMKILNLYAGIGGNRVLWGKEHEITAVELDHEIAEIYKKRFPEDKVIVADAHNFLLENFEKYDFIWASPPCQSHSDIRRLGVDTGQTKPIFPDMKLYQEIIFLQNFCKTKFCVENVRPYYDPLIKPTAKIGRHLFWSNFYLENFEGEQSEKIQIKNVTGSSEVFGFSLKNFNIRNKRQILRNQVDPKISEHILKCAL